MKRVPTTEDDLKTLGLAPGASWDEVLQKGRALRKEFHPDTTKHNPSYANRQFLKIQPAIERLRIHYGRPNSSDGQKSDRPSGPDQTVSTSITLTPDYVDFGTVPQGAHPPDVKVVITCLGFSPTKAPQLSPDQGGYWKSYINTRGGADVSFEAVFMYTGQPYMPVGNHDEATILTIDDYEIEIPVELTVVPSSFAVVRGNTSRQRHEVDEDVLEEGQEEDEDDDETSGLNFSDWLIFSILGVIIPFGYIALTLPEDGQFGAGGGFMTFLCGAWTLFGLPGLLFKTWKEYQERKKS